MTHNVGDAAAQAATLGHTATALLQRGFHPVPGSSASGIGKRSRTDTQEIAAARQLGTLADGAVFLSNQGSFDDHSPPLLLNIKARVNDCQH